MNRKQALQELKRRTEPYRFFWEEWTRHEACFLQKSETDLVNMHLKNGFKLSWFNCFHYNNQPEPIYRVSQKLLRNYTLFQEWVIFDFLCLLIRMAREYESGGFFSDPICELRLPEELKLNLKAFRIHHVGQLSMAYKPIDLKRSWVFDNIVDFHRLCRKYNLLGKTALYTSNLTAKASPG